MELPGKKQAIKSRQISLDKPLWNGEFWFIERKNKSNLGTNSHDADKLTIYITWNQFNLSSVNYLNESKLIGRIVKEFKNSDSLTNETLKQEFIKHGVINQSGKSLISIINKTSKNMSEKNNDLFWQMTSLAANIADLYIEAAKVNFTDHNRFNSSSQAHIFVYYKVMLKIIENLIRSNIVSYPPALKGNLRNSYSQIILIVRSD